MTSSVGRFWHATPPADRAVWMHPAVFGNRPDELAMTIPWSTHGDGVPVSKTGAGNMSLNVLSHRGATRPPAKSNCSYMHQYSQYICVK